MARSRSVTDQRTRSPIDTTPAMREPSRHGEVGGTRRVVARRHGLMRLHSQGHADHVGRHDFADVGRRRIALLQHDTEHQIALREDPLERLASHDEERADVRCAHSVDRLEHGHLGRDDVARRAAFRLQDVFECLHGGASRREQSKGRIRRTRDPFLATFVHGVRAMREAGPSCAMPLGESADPIPDTHGARASRVLIVDGDPSSLEIYRYFPVPRLPRSARRPTLLARSELAVAEAPDVVVFGLDPSQAQRYGRTVRGPSREPSDT